MRAEDEEPPRKKNNTTTTENSWLVLDDTMELNLKDDYLPVPEPTSVLANDDDDVKSDYEGNALLEAPIAPTRTSDVYSLIS